MWRNHTAVDKDGGLYHHHRRSLRRSSSLSTALPPVHKLWHCFAVTFGDRDDTDDDAYHDDSDELTNNFFQGAKTYSTTTATATYNQSHSSREHIDREDIQVPYLYDAERSGRRPNLNCVKVDDFVNRDCLQKNQPQSPSPKDDIYTMMDDMTRAQQHNINPRRGSVPESPWRPNRGRNAPFQPCLRATTINVATTTFVVDETASVATGGDDSRMSLLVFEPDNDDASSSVGLHQSRNGAILRSAVDATNQFPFMSTATTTNDDSFTRPHPSGKGAIEVDIRLPVARNKESTSSFVVLDWEANWVEIATASDSVSGDYSLALGTPTLSKCFAAAASTGTTKMATTTQVYPLPPSRLTLDGKMSLTGKAPCFSTDPTMPTFYGRHHHHHYDMPACRMSHLWNQKIEV